jgi:hypothetical protein
MNISLLIPDELCKQIPAIRGQEGNVNPTAYALLHRPGEYQAWLITELEGDIAFAWVIDHDDGEYGDFYLSALVAEMPEVIQKWDDGNHNAFSNGPHAGRVVRDPEFTPRQLLDARKYYDELWQRKNGSDS